MLAMLAVLAVVGQFGVSAAEAGNKGQRQANARPSGSYSYQVQRTANGHARSDTWTNAEGRSASRNATVVNDKDAGTRTRDVQRQGPEGQTATRNATAIFDPTAKTWIKDVNVSRGEGG
jgi:hypothetical protein